MDTPEDHSALRYSYLKKRCTENASIGLGHGLCARQCVWALSQCRKGPAEIEVLSTRGVWKSTLELVVISNNCLGAGAFHPWKKGDGIKTSPTQVDLKMAWSQEMKVIAEPMKWFRSFKCPPVLLLLSCGRVWCDSHGITADAMDASESWSMGAALAALCHTLSWEFLESNFIIVPCRAVPDTTKSHN